MRNTIDLSQVSFPVYRLSKVKPSQEYGLLYYCNEYFNVDTAEFNRVVSIVDDTNIREQTLSRRRLRAKAQGTTLYPLRKAIFFLGDFIKMAKKGYWFIDSNGKLFTYVKSTKTPLIFRKIKKIIPTKGTGSLIEVEGIPNRFKTLYIVNNNMRYAGILSRGHTHVLYGVYDRKYKDTWRLM